MHAAGSEVRDRRGGGGDPGDTDVCPGRCGRVGCDEKERGEADVPQHEPDETARERREETPETDACENEGMQGA